MTPRSRSGPLVGLRVLELAGIGPGPHAAMVLADLGADVVRVERPGPPGGLGPADVTLRGRRWVRADLKKSSDLAVVMRLVHRADVLLEGFRPGVAERLGVGPQDCLRRNPRLVYGRMTGWGQDGPRATQAGHDLNYLSMTGALAAMGRPGSAPSPPLNLVADYGGGSMLLLVGVLSALVERERSGRGQVVDAAMVDGVSLLCQLMWSMRGISAWTDERGVNLLDGGAPFYDCYTCSDGRFVAVAALEPRFFVQLLEGLGLDPADLPEQYDSSRWPELREQLASRIGARSRDEWAAVFDGTDACVTPVLTFGEASLDPHLSERRSVVEVDGVVQAGPAPRFSRSVPGEAGATRVGDDTHEVLDDWCAGEERS